MSSIPNNKIEPPNPIPTTQTQPSVSSVNQLPGTQAASAIQIQPGFNPRSPNLRTNTKKLEITVDFPVTSTTQTNLPSDESKLTRLITLPPFTPSSRNPKANPSPQSRNNPTPKHIVTSLSTSALKGTPGAPTPVNLNPSPEKSPTSTPQSISNLVTSFSASALRSPASSPSLSPSWSGHFTPTTISLDETEKQELAKFIQLEGKHPNSLPKKESPTQEETPEP